MNFTKSLNAYQVNIVFTKDQHRIHISAAKFSSEPFSSLSRKKPANMRHNHETIATPICPHIFLLNMNFTFMVYFNDLFYNMHWNHSFCSVFCIHLTWFMSWVWKTQRLINTVINLTIFINKWNVGLAV